MNTQDANATAAEILSGKKAGVGGQMVTGAMKNNGAVEGTISSKDEEYTVPQGFHDGSGKVKIHADEKAKLVANNIREARYDSWCCRQYDRNRRGQSAG